MITVASSGKASRATDSAGTEVLPVDVESISESTEAALSMQMATSTRKEMNASLPEIVGHLNYLRDAADITRRLLWIYTAPRARCPVSVREDQVVRELSHYIYEHPDERMALMPVYDAARDHAQRGTCTHSRCCWIRTTRSEGLPCVCWPRQSESGTCGQNPTAMAPS
ncbi:hypothetical protein ACFTZF_23235 [Streptomyces mirabilis]|uniref:hypothetical protein n=1 Tax=Streptomyces mirabilis TaxID=68239 RepID=UPI00362D21D4